MLFLFTRSLRHSSLFCVPQLLGIHPYFVLLPRVSPFLHQNLAKTCKNVQKCAKTWKNREKEILAGVWSLQHPNTGQNMQDFTMCHYEPPLSVLRN